MRIERDLCISTRDEVERNEVKSANQQISNSSVHQFTNSPNHQFTTRDEVERNEVKSSIHQFTTSPHPPLHFLLVKTTVDTKLRDGYITVCRFVKTLSKIL